MSADQRLTIDVDGQPREFLLHLPDRSPGNVPLIVMFHGRGGTAAWAADETGWSTWADANGFAVVYPHGLPPDPTKPAKFLTNPPTWRDGLHGADDRAEQEADLRFISLMLDSLIAQFAVDADRIFLTGFSNGAGMTFFTAANLAERIAAIAPVAGYCWLDDPRPARAVPTLYLIGDSDPLVPLAGGLVSTPWGRPRLKPSVATTLRKWARVIGCSETPVQVADDPAALLEEFPNGTSEHRFQSLTIHGLGHHWPGGKGKLSDSLGGPLVTTINACERIGAFFQKVAPDASLRKPSSVDTSGS